MSDKKEIEKIIDTKQKFADYAYKEYRSDKFGMTSCCASQLDKYSMDDELCIWEANKKTIYDEDTYTFTTWNWNSWLVNDSNPVEAPGWVQRRRDRYSQRRLYGMNVPYIEDGPSGGDTAINTYKWGMVDATATSAGNMTCEFKTNVFDNATAIVVRGTSRVYALCLKDNTDAAKVFDYGPGAAINFNNEFLSLLTTAGAPDMSGWFTCPSSSCGSMAQRIQSAWGEYIWWKLDFIILNPGGDLVPAAGDLTITMKENDGGTAPGAKNGANDGDFLFFLLVSAGELPGQTQILNNQGATAGPNSMIALVSAGQNAPRFSIRENNDMVPGGAIYGNVFEAGAAGGIGTGYGLGNGYAMYEQNNNSIIGTYPPGGANQGINIGIRAMVSYANVGLTSIGWCYPGPDCDSYPPNTYIHPVYGAYTNRADYRTCIDDTELLYITVKDKNAAPVKDYDILIDNTYYGKTDASGSLTVNIKYASTDTKHIINGCKCFTTTGNCNQQKIDIVLKDAVKPVCTNLEIDCL